MFITIPGCVLAVKLVSEGEKSSPHTKDASPPPLLSSCSLLSIPSVVVTISTSANPQQSGGMHLLVARSVLLLPVVQADCVEQRPSRRRRTKSDHVDNKNLFQNI